MQRKPSSLAVIRSVGRVTFVEIVRDKVLYNSVLCALLLMGAAYLASRLSFTRPERIVIDFGLTVINVASALIAIFIGAPMLSKEFERRTIFVALSKPISRFQFLLGKYCGLMGVITVNWLLLFGCYMAILYFVGGHPSATLVWGVFLLLIQTFLIAAIAILFSAFSTASISAMFTIGLYLLGNNITQIRFVAAKTEVSFMKNMLNTAAVILPNMEYFNLGTKVTYALPISGQEAAMSLAYGVVMVCAVLAFSGLLIQKKDF